MLYGNNCYIFIENFSQKFSPCEQYWGQVHQNFILRLFYCWLLQSFIIIIAIAIVIVVFVILNISLQCQGLFVRIRKLSVSFLNLILSIRLVVRFLPRNSFSTFGYHFYELAGISSHRVPGKLYVPTWLNGKPDIAHVLDKLRSGAEGKRSGRRKNRENTWRNLHLGKLERQDEKYP